MRNIFIMYRSNVVFRSVSRNLRKKLNDIYSKMTIEGLRESPKKEKGSLLSPTKKERLKSYYYAKKLDIYQEL